MMLVLLMKLDILSLFKRLPEQMVMLLIKWSLTLKILVML
ncbi:hypothetical protein EVA_21360 [gut metagenome]|uniref:Uncharacterized protein n=1 Tax=gut metagenome TaxID=749906 RepID=J9F7Y2_9ZZZZ